MQYQSHATGQDLVSEINALCDSDATSYPIADKTRRVNMALEELIGDIINADGTWEYDDTNWTDLPVGTGTLVASQEAYTFASEYLEVRQVKVKSAAGEWVVLRPIDYSDFTNVSLEQSFPTAGMPEYYDIIGDTIRLYPAPASASVTLASGLKVNFTRTADLFTTTDTTQEPGLPSPYHVLLAYMAALPYCMSYKKDRVALFQKKVDDMKKSLIKFYSRREKDKRKVMTMAPINYI